MEIIKLDATDSTNRYLKDLSKEIDLKNFTVVYAKKQTDGKGQMGSIWISEEDKNLTMSILVKDVLSEISQIFDLNVTITCSVFEVLQTLNIPNLTIKWPNDIMSADKKIGGIMIENTINSTKTVSIVGIGLNVNQTEFGHLPKASSLLNITNNNFDVENLMVNVSKQIEHNCQNLQKHSAKAFWEIYKKHLFKKNVPMAFENKLGQKFMGIIKEVEKNGKIKIQLEDDNFGNFGIKEVTMLY